MTCSSTAIELDAGTNAPPTAPKGIIRNNIMSGGVCNSLLTSTNLRTDFSEARATTDPRVFQNNDLDPSGTGSLTLYLDEGTTAQTSVDAVNRLTDITTGSNISAEPEVRFAAHRPASRRRLTLHRRGNSHGRTSDRLRRQDPQPHHHPEAQHRRLPVS